MRILKPESARELGVDGTAVVHALRRQAGHFVKSHCSECGHERLCCPFCGTRKDGIEAVLVSWISEVHGEIVCLPCALECKRDPEQIFNAITEAKRYL